MSSDFRIRTCTVRAGSYSYATHKLTGWLNGERIRRNFKSHAEALGEKNRLEVKAANLSGEIRAANTRLSPAQLAEAEAAIRRLGDKPLSLAVEWFLTNYRPPAVEMAIEAAADAFLRDRDGTVSRPVRADYRKTLNLLQRTFPGRAVHTITAPELEAMMKTRGKAPKSWNNLRTYLHAFFEFCGHDTRRWVATNPVKAIRVLEVARGLPHILPAATVRALFAWLEKYSGPPRRRQKRGYLVPYFALATFAGIRPGVEDGELRKIHDLVDKSRVIDLKLGVIRITPDLAKTNSLRQITIQPNLAAWLRRYPLEKFPLMVRNMSDHVGIVRKRFALAHDVLRHTFVSMHVAKFKSLGATALEAGNSEAIIRRHYLNLMSAAEAEAFWSIAPGAIGEIMEIKRTVN